MDRNTREISEPEEVKEKLKESEELYKIILEQSMIGIIIIQEGKVKYANEKLAEIYELEPEIFYNWQPGEFLKVVHPDSREFVAEQVRKKMLGLDDSVTNYMYKAITQSGKVIWLENYSNSIMFQGEPAILAIQIDVTDKVQMGQQLKESEEKYRLLANNINDIIWTMDLDLNMMYVSPSVESILGFTPQENMVMPINEKFTPDSMLQITELVKEHIKPKNINDPNYNPTFTLEVEQFHKDGSIVPAEVRVNPIRNEDGIAIGLVGITRDITKRKQTQNKLKESEEDYREAYNLANFYKDLFAHDMNNILQSIVSAADYYKIFRYKPEMLDRLGDISDVIVQHAKRGANLISNVRKLSRLEESEVILKPINLSQVLNKSIEHSIISFRERNVDIQVKGLTGDLMISGDELLIDVFDNILNNAIKYTTLEQEIIVEIEISKFRKDNTSYIRVEVKDRGIGIPDDLKKNLFKKSRNTDISRRGMGMGLSLVKTIVEKYGGMIKIKDRIEGDYAKGSNFILLLKEA